MIGFPSWVWCAWAASIIRRAIQAIWHAWCSDSRWRPAATQYASPIVSTWKRNVLTPKSSNFLENTAIIENTFLRSYLPAFGEKGHSLVDTKVFFFHLCEYQKISIFNLIAAWNKNKLPTSMAETNPIYFSRISSKNVFLVVPCRRLAAHKTRQIGYKALATCWWL